MPHQEQLETKESELEFHQNNPSPQASLSIFKAFKKNYSITPYIKPPLADKVQLYLDQETPDTHSAFLHMENADFTRSKAHYQFVLDKQLPEVQKTEALISLGLVCLFSENIEKGKSYFQQASELKSNDSYLEEARELWNLVLEIYAKEKNNTELLEQLSKNEEKDAISPVYVIQLTALRHILEYDKKGNFSYEAKDRLDQQLQTLLTSLDKLKEDTATINNTFIVIGLSLIARGEIDKALLYFDKIVALTYVRRRDGIEYDIDEQTHRKHFLYYLYKAKDQVEKNAYAKCIEISLKGLTYYPNSEQLITILGQNVSKLLSLVLMGEKGYEDALKQLSLLIESRSYLIIIAQLPEEYRVLLCRDLIIYLESQMRFYEAQKLTQTLMASSNADLNQALRYEQEGNFLFFYEELEKADELYQKAIILYHRDERYHCFELVCLIQRYTIAVTTNWKVKPEQLSILTQSILELSKVVLPNKAEQQKLAQALFVAASDEITPIDVPAGLGASMILEQKGVILFFKKQYDESREYFNLLKTNFPQSSLIKRWDSYINRIRIETLDFNSNMLSFDLKEILEDQVDIALLKLRCKYCYQGKWSIDNELYVASKQLLDRYPDYLPVKDWCRTINTQYLLECQEKFLLFVVSHLEKIPDLKLFFIPKMGDDVKKELLSKVELFFQATPVASKKLLSQKIEEPLLERLASLLTKKIPKSPNFFSPILLDHVSQSLTQSLPEWWSSIMGMPLMAAEHPAGEPQPNAFSIKPVQIFEHDPTWSNKQQQFFERLGKKLNDEFTVARLLVEGELVYPNKGRRLCFESAGVLALTGTQIPGIGSISMGIGMALKTIEVALRTKDEGNTVNMAKKIMDFSGSTCKHTLYLADQMARMLTVMFQEQINRLTDDSLTVFSKSLSTLMIAYLATDFGKNSTLGSWIYQGMAEAIKGLYDQLRPSHSREQFLEEKQDKRMLLLQSLFCTKLTSKTPLTLEDNAENLLHPWFVEGILTDTAIRSVSGLCYSSKQNSEYLRYGFRFMPDELAATTAERLNYSLVKSESIAQLQF